MPRPSNACPAAPVTTKAIVAERRSACPRARFRVGAKAHNVCGVTSYVRVSPCAKSQMARTAVHWFDPRLARIIEVGGRMH
jgi:hypothetical protein